MIVTLFSGAALVALALAFEIGRAAEARRTWRDRSTLRALLVSGRA